MAVAEVIGAAIGILLLVMVAYLIVGGTLSVAETVATAQKDITATHEARLRTDMEINAGEISILGTGLNFSVTNTGDEIIADYTHIDLYTDNSSGLGYQRFTYNRDLSGLPGTWSLVRIDNDNIHPGQIDPGEKAWFWATFAGSTPAWVQVTTNNGVYAQTVFP